jgi:SAM-dependent methyltransferase
MGSVSTVGHMQRLAILDSPLPDASAARRELGVRIEAALQDATTDPARMLPLWTAFSRGEPVRAEDLRRVLCDQVVAEAVRHELLVAVDVGDSDPWLRGSICIVAADVAGELLWVASDFPWYDQEPLAVTGPGAASETLLAAVPDGEYPRVLDIGCGSGAVGVHLVAVGRRTLTASDVNPRALALTELTAALNGRSVRVALSDFADQLDGQHDLIVCNPPFILGRPAGRTTFRDSVDGSGHADLALDLASLLAADGLALYLTNWEYGIGGTDPLEQLGSRLTAIDGCDVLVIERAVVPVAEYVRVWSEDEGEQRAWTASFCEREVAHVGTGVVAVHRVDRVEHTVSLARDYRTPRDELGALVGRWACTRTLQR